MKTQDEELQEVLKKNLPQQVGETLRLRLEQADKDAAVLIIEKKSVVNLTEQVIELLQQIETYKKFDDRNASLEAREKQLELNERQFEVNTLKYELSAEKDKTTFSQNIALGLVRNTEYRKTIFDSENLGGLGMTDGNGQYHYPTTTTKNHTSTETKE